MAKVTIAIEDVGDDVKIRTEFDPPLDHSGNEVEAVARMTNAQKAGAYAAMQLMDGATDVEAETSDEEE